MVFLLDSFINLRNVSPLEGSGGFFMLSMCHSNFPISPKTFWGYVLLTDGLLAVKLTLLFICCSRNTSSAKAKCSKMTWFSVFFIWRFNSFYEPSRGQAITRVKHSLPEDPISDRKQIRSLQGDLFTMWFIYNVMQEEQQNGCVNTSGWAKAKITNKMKLNWFPHT